MARGFGPAPVEKVSDERRWIRMHDWQELARDVLDLLGDIVHRQGFPTWLRVFEDLEEETGLRVEASPDSTGLLGWRAPHDCIAVGMVATGRARVTGHSEETSGGLSSSSELADRVNDAGGVLSLRMACVVSRDGEVGWWMELPDSTLRTEPPAAGRMLDVLLRCFNLPTPPPDDPASEIHSAAWLASVIDGGMSSDRRLTWSDVEQLHPLARVLAGDLDVRVELSDEGDDVAREQFEGLLRIAAAACSWEEIRMQAARGELKPFIEPELAAWMDEGMFSRWLSAIIPSIDHLLEATRPLLVPSAARRLAHAVHRAPADPARTGSGR